MWNPTARALHSRTGLRYGSDLTDAEWAIVAPLLPKPCDRGEGSYGMPTKTDRSELWKRTLL